MDQKCVRNNHHHQEPIKLAHRGAHPQCIVEPGDIWHDHSDDADECGWGDNGERGTRLDERYFTRSKEMNNEELLRRAQNSVGPSLFRGWSNLTCVIALSMNQFVCARGTSEEL